MHIVDAFTDRPFAGNPAAVCLLVDTPSDEWMQAVAAEMNLSETAFVGVPDDRGRRSLRWFTPVVEIDLCGHATLASAHVLWESGLVEHGDEISFDTRSGVLTARRADTSDEDGGVRLHLDFPKRPPVEVDRPAGLAQALGIYPSYVGRAEEILLVELRSAQEVRALRPDLEALRRVEAHGIIVTAPGGGEGCDFVSRYFSPQVGIDEDPVTGSAHCVLGPFWGQRLSKTEMCGQQASARGGEVWVTVLDDRVVLGGQAVTVLSGTLHAAP